MTDATKKNAKIGALTGGGGTLGGGGIVWVFWQFVLMPMNVSIERNTAAVALEFEQDLIRIVETEGREAAEQYAEKYHAMMGDTDQ